jgi:predicted metal-dependent phosphoesterase TrpH
MIALTDHDTTEGLDEFLTTAHEIGVTALAGVELTCEAGTREVHVLGYFVADRWREPRLQEALALARQHRADRVRLMLGQLAQHGVHLEFDEVATAQASGSSLGRPHVAAALQRRQLVRNAEEAFARFLRPGKPGFVAHTRMPAAEAIRLIRAAGGISVVAHPGLTGVDREIPGLCQAGLRGLEVWHPRHSQMESARYLAMAEQHGLLPTGGSDSHGATVGRAVIGAVDVPMERAEALRQATAAQPAE